MKQPWIKGKKKQNKKKKRNRDEYGDLTLPYFLLPEPMEPSYFISF